MAQWQTKWIFSACVVPKDAPKTEEGRATYTHTMELAIPAFVYYLLEEHIIPDELKIARGGVKVYQHPALVEELLSESKEDDCGA